MAADEHGRSRPDSCGAAKGGVAVLGEHVGGLVQLLCCTQLHREAEVARGCVLGIHGTVNRTLVSKHICPAGDETNRSVQCTAPTRMPSPRTSVGLP